MSDKANDKDIPEDMQAATPAAEGDSEESAGGEEAGTAAAPAGKNSGQEKPPAGDGDGEDKPRCRPPTPEEIEQASREFARDKVRSFARLYPVVREEFLSLADAGGVMPGEDVIVKVTCALLADAGDMETQHILRALGGELQLLNKQTEVLVAIMARIGGYDGGNESGLITPGR